MKNYEVRTGCEIAGRWRVAGEIVALSSDQARELAQPFGNVVSEVKERMGKDAKFNRRRRRDRQASN